MNVLSKIFVTLFCVCSPLLLLADDPGTPCDDSDPLDNSCPLDDWIFILAFVVVVIVAIHLYRHGTQFKTVSGLKPGGIYIPDTVKISI